MAPVHDAIICWAGEMEVAAMAVCHDERRRDGRMQADRKG